MNEIRNERFILNNISNFQSNNLNILRIIGYSQGINYKQKETNKLIQIFLNKIDLIMKNNENENNENNNENNKINSILFDGDHYNEESFTYLIPLIHNKYNELEIYCIRKYEDNLNEFIDSWNNTTIRRMNILIDDIKSNENEESKYDKYTNHAIKFYEWQEPYKVFCFGGGNAVVNEFLHIKNNIPRHIDKFHLFHIQRIVNGQESWSALKEEGVPQIYTHEDE